MEDAMAMAMQRNDVRARNAVVEDIDHGAAKMP